MAGPTACLVRSAGGAVQKAQTVPAFNNAELPGGSSCSLIYTYEHISMATSIMYQVWSDHSLELSTKPNKILLHAVSCWLKLGPSGRLLLLQHNAKP